jgi:hypothetical protein
MARSWFVALLSFVGITLSGVPAWAQKPAITFRPPPRQEDDRPVIKEIVVGTQGTDYAMKLEFNMPPWGDSCANRCANATIFLDTDNNKTTGLKLKDAKAAETGADLALTVQGLKLYQEKSARSGLKVIVRQFTEESTDVDSGKSLVELDPVQDPERVLAQGSSVFLLIDANIGNLPAGSKMRVVYHPPESKALVATVHGLNAPAGRIELYKDGKWTTSGKKKKKSDYEKL